MGRARFTWTVIVIAGTLVTWPLSLFGQSLVVSVRQDGTHAPIAGAIVSVIAARDTAIAARFTNDSGIVVLRPPAPGTYRIVARRVGYRPAEGSVTVFADRIARIEVSLETRAPFSLNPVVVSGSSACASFDDDRSLVYGLWEQIRAALEANRLVESEGLVRMEVEKYERDLDRGLSERSKRVETREETTRQPFSAAPAAQLEASGYVRSDADSTVYFAPDARTLLSEEFAHSHCFSVEPGKQETANMIGLSFAPKRDIVRPDIAGVLWLDRSSSALDHLSYSYVNVSSAVSLEGIGGRIDFAQLPSGGWVIPRWYIRMPRLARITRYAGGYYRPAVVDTLIGFHEAGGSARILSDTEGSIRSSTVVSAAPSAPLPDSGAMPTAKLCEDSTKVGNTIIGRITDVEGRRVSDVKLFISWSTFRITRVGTLVSTDERRRSIEIDPDGSGQYVVCGLPLHADYRLELKSGNRTLENKYIADDRRPDTRPDTTEMNFTVALRDSTKSRD
jgi:hypothetical protein